MKMPYQQLSFLILFSFLLLIVQPAFASDPTQTDETAFTVSGKTFVYRNNIWIDTTYDPVQHPLYRIGVHSDQYDAFEASVGRRTLNSYRRLGERLLIVHDGWGIELEDSAVAGPIVSNETGEPKFLRQYQPENPPRVISTGTGNQSPNLIASSKAENGINIHIHIGWGELFGFGLLACLIGLGIWLGLREPVVENS